VQGTAPPRRPCWPGPTASRHESPAPLRVGILRTRAASSCPVPRRTHPKCPAVRRACSLLSAPTEVCRRTGELWWAHPFIVKTGSRPAIKAAHCPTRRPTSSSSIDAPRRAPISRPYHHRPSALTTSHIPTPPPRVIGCTARAAPFAGAELQRPPSHRAAGPARRRPLRPVSGHKPSHGEPLVLPHLFPGQGRAAGAAQFRRAAPPSMPKDYIASPSFFPGSFL
jgi:hypothetical protein